MKLKSITFKSVPRIPGLRAGDLSTLDIDNPGQALFGWRVSLRGPSVALISPRGWTTANATQPKMRDQNGACVVHIMPPNEAYLQWEAQPDELEAILKGGLKYECELGPKLPAIDPTKALLEQIPAGQVGDA